MTSPFHVRDAIRVTGVVKRSQKRSFPSKSEIASLPSPNRTRRRRFVGQIEKDIHPTFQTHTNESSMQHHDTIMAIPTSPTTRKHGTAASSSVMAPPPPPPLTFPPNSPNHHLVTRHPGGSYSSPRVTRRGAGILGGSLPLLDLEN